MRHILFWGIYAVNGLGHYLQLIFFWSGRTVLLAYLRPPNSRTLLQNSAYSPRASLLAAALGVFTASIVFGGVGRVVLFSYYKSILLCILLCVILTVSPCSFFYLLIAFAQIHSPSSTPSCSNNIVGGANTPINILLPAQDIHRPICGRVVLFYLCSGTAPTFSVVEIDIGTCDCIVDLAAVLHDTAILIASYSLVTLVLVALGPFWWREIPRAELTAR